MTKTFRTQRTFVQLKDGIFCVTSVNMKFELFSLTEAFLASCVSAYERFFARVDEIMAFKDLFLYEGTVANVTFEGFFSWK